MNKRASEHVHRRRRPGRADARPAPRQAGRRRAGARRARDLRARVPRRGAAAEHRAPARRARAARLHAGAAALASRGRQGPARTAREIGEFSFKKIAPEYPYAIWMPQPVFLAALLRKAEPLPSFKCWMGAQVSRLIQEDGRTVGVSGMRHGNEPFEVRADVVVGADGRYSTIAKMGGLHRRVPAPRLRPRLVHDRAAARLVEHAVHLARRRGPRADAAEIPAPHPGRHRAAGRRMEARGGRRAWRRWPTACGGSIRSSRRSPTGCRTSRRSSRSKA